MTSTYERYVAAQSVGSWSLRMDLLADLILEDQVAYVEAARRFYQ